MSNITRTNIFEVSVVLKQILSYLNANEIINLYKSNITSHFYVGEDMITMFSKRHLVKTNQLLRDLNFPLQNTESFNWMSMARHISRTLQKFKYENNKMISDCHNIETYCISRDNLFSKPILKHCRIEILWSKDPLTQMYNFLYFDFKTLCSIKYLKSYFGKDIFGDMELSPVTLVKICLKDNGIDWKSFLYVVDFLKYNFKTVTHLCWPSAINEIKIIDLKNEPETFCDSLFNLTFRENMHAASMHIFPKQF